MSYSSGHKQSVVRLYRSIFRTHKRKLPADLRLLGDNYVRDEFRAHRNVSPSIALQFLQSWTNYLMSLRSQPGMVRGTHLDDEQLHSFNGDQIARLEDLQRTAFELPNKS